MAIAGLLYSEHGSFFFVSFGGGEGVYDCVGDPEASLLNEAVSLSRTLLSNSAVLPTLMSYWLWDPFQLWAPGLPLPDSLGIVFSFAAGKLRGGSKTSSKKQHPWPLKNVKQAGEILSLSFLLACRPKLHLCFKHEYIQSSQFLAEFSIIGQRTIPSAWITHLIKCNNFIITNEKEHFWASVNMYQTNVDTEKSLKIEMCIVCVFLSKCTQHSTYYFKLNCLLVIWTVQKNNLNE